MARHKVEICGVNTANLKVLSNEEMLELFKKYQNGEKSAKEDIVNGNLPINSFTADSIQMPKLVNAPKEVSNARTGWRNQKNYIISILPTL